MTPDIRHIFAKGCKNASSLAPGSSCIIIYPANGNHAAFRHRCNDCKRSTPLRLNTLETKCETEACASSEQWTRRHQDSHLLGHTRMPSRDRAVLSSIVDAGVQGSCIIRDPTDESVIVIASVS